MLCIKLQLILSLIVGLMATDPMRTDYAKGVEVVNAVCENIRRSAIFANDYNFLFRVAIVESNLGEHPSTYNGVSGGIWQVDRNGLEDTKNTRSHPALQKRLDKVKNYFGIDWKKVTFEDLKKPLYSGLAARILLSNKSAAIPSTLEGQAQYWKTHYNTAAGKGTVQDFISRVNRHSG